MGKRGIIIVHGTSQDIMSHKENTVKIAKQALSEGLIVTEIAGPGSPTRIILDSQMYEPGKFEFTPVDEIGLPLDYAFDWATGNAVGTGVEAIVEELKVAISRMIKDGATEIQLVGFSRGAVALAIALERIDKEMIRKGIHVSCPITVFLIDPVPGPMLVQKSVRIPSWIEEVTWLVSKNENRPGFRQLKIRYSETTRFLGHLVIGGHGDLGGSKSSDISTMVYDDIAKYLRLKRNMTDHDRSEVVLKIFTESAQYTAASWSSWVCGRVFDSWNTASSFLGSLEMPSSHWAKDFWRMPAVRELLAPHRYEPRRTKILNPGFRADSEWHLKKLRDLRDQHGFRFLCNPAATQDRNTGLANFPPPSTRIFPGPRPRGPIPHTISTWWPPRPSTQTLVRGARKLFKR